MAADFREEAYILEKMELSEDEDDGEFKYEEIEGLEVSGALDQMSIKEEEEDDDDLNNFEALKAKTTMK